MPSYYKIQTATISNTNQESSAINITGHNGIAIELPTFSIGLNTDVAAVYLKGADTSAGTYREVYAQGVYSGVCGIARLEVPEGNGNYTVSLGPETVSIPNFVKVCITGTNATATTTGYDAVVHMYI